MAEAVRVARAFRTARRIEDAAEELGLGWRKTLRVLHSLESAGWTVNKTRIGRYIFWTVSGNPLR